MNKKNMSEISRAELSPLINLANRGAVYIQIESDNDFVPTIVDDFINALKSDLIIALLQVVERRQR
jgi:hypothetical protein